MSITATEFKNNMGKYLALSAKEDIYISKNGKVIAKLSNPNKNRMQMAEALIGVIPTDITLQEAKDERVEKI